MKRTLPFAWAKAQKQPPRTPAPERAIHVAPRKNTLRHPRSPLAPPQLDVVAPERIRPVPVPLPPLSIDAPADLLEVVSFVRSVDPVKVKGLHLSKAEVVSSPEIFLTSHVSALEAVPFTAAALTFYRRVLRLREILEAS